MKTPDCFSLEFLPYALRDMTEIVSTFMMLGSKQGATRIKDKMIKASERISEHPYSGATLSDKKLANVGYRMVVIENYLMFYRIFEEDKKVIVYRVLNGKRDYPNILNGMI